LFFAIIDTDAAIFADRAPPFSIFHATLPLPPLAAFAD